TQPDVTVPLQAAIETATASGAIAYLPPAVYGVSAPLELPAGATVCGFPGATILSASIDRGAWAPGRALVEIVGVGGVGVHDLVLDHRGDERFTTDTALTFTMLLSNTANDVVSNVVFRDPGAAVGAPSAPALLLLARDPADPPWLTDTGTHVGQVGAVEGVEILDSRFELGVGANDWFAIRLHSMFGRSPETYIHHVDRVTIRGCAFTGDYAWNTVELAGGGVYGNTVASSTFDGATLAHVDLDKGTYGNSVLDNVVTRAGRPTALYTVLPEIGYVPRVAAFADHGFDGVLRNADNVFDGNVVLAMVEHAPAVVDPAAVTSDEGGFYLAYTDRPTLIGNEVVDVYGGLRGTGILFEDDVADARLERNVIGAVGLPRTVAYGIRTANASTGIEAPTVYANEVYVAAAGITLVGSATGSDGYVVDGNWVDSRSTGLAAVSLLGVDAPVLTRNATVGGYHGYELVAPGLIGDANLADAAASYSFAVWADATLTGSHVSGPGQVGVPFPHCLIGPGAHVTATGGTLLCP
ncbi:MAG: hypothetical protein ABMB14_31950, partial [Myxococcota bacterium]